MADALDLGSSAARRVGSSPTFRTKRNGSPRGPFCFKWELKPSPKRLARLFAITLVWNSVPVAERPGEGRTGVGNSGAAGLRASICG